MSREDSVIQARDRQRQAVKMFFFPSFLVPLPLTHLTTIFP
jgi:hypothetical protein